MFATRLLWYENDRDDQLAFQYSSQTGHLADDYAIATSLATAKAILAHQSIAAALIHVKPEDTTVGELLSELSDRQIPTIVAVQWGNEELALVLIERGATDYVIKDPHDNYLKLLPIRIHKLLEQTQRPQIVSKGTKENLNQAKSVHTDIRDRKRATMTLAEREVELHHIFDQMAVGIANASLDGRLIAANQKYCDLLGYALDEIVTKTFVELTHPEDRDTDHQLVQSLLKGKIPFFSMEKRYLHKNGTYIWVNLTVSPIRDANGETKSLLGVVYDISDRKRTEETLQQSESKYRALIEALPDLIMRFSGEGIYLDFFPTQAFKLIGDRDAVGMSLFDRNLPLDLVHKRMKYIQQALQTGQLQVYEQQITVNGELRTEESRVLVCGDNEVLVIVRDISDRKQAEQTLQNLVEGAAAVSGANFFPALAEYVTTVLDVRYVAICLRSPAGLHTYAFWENGQLQPNVSISLENTPYERTLTEGMYYCPDRLQHHFPNHPALITLEAESYLGVALTNNQREVIGSFCVMSDQLLPNPERTTAVLRVFAARISAELERQAAIDALQQFNQKLEQRVVERTAELQQANNQLQQAIADRQRLAAIVENSTDFIGMATLTGRMIYLNAAGRRLVGLDEKTDITELLIQDFHFPEERTKLQQTLKQALEQGSSCQEEIRLRHFQTGQAITVQCSDFVIKHPQTGGPIAIAGILRDVGDRKRSEEELRRLSERLTLAMRSGGFGTWEYDFIHNTLIWDERMFELYGVNPTDFTGQYDDWANQLHPDDRPKNPTFDWQALADNNNEYDTEFRVVHSTGEVRFLKAYGIVVSNEQGDPVQIIGVNFDITDRKRVEAALQASEARNRAIVEAIPDLLLRLRRDGTCLDCILPANNPMAHFVQISHHMSEVLPPNLLQRELQIIEQAITTGELQIFEHELIKDGQVSYEEVRLAAINTDEVLAIVRDISDRKRTELELKRNQDLRAAIFEESTDALFVIDPATNLIIDCNRRAVEQFEVDSKADLLHRSGATLQRYPLTDKEVAQITRELKHTGMWSHECEYMTYKGNYFWASMAARKILVADQERRLVRLTDITVRKQIELMLQQQLERERLLVSLLRRTLDSFDLNPILETTVVEVRNLLQVDRLLIYQLHEDYSGVVITEAIAGSWQPLLNLALPAEAFPEDCYHRYLQEAICVINDSETDPILDCMAQFMRDLQIRAKLVVPIVQQENERLWGLLIAHQCSAPKQWQAWEVTLLQQLASYLAVAIKQSKLYHQLQIELSDRKQAEINLQNANQELQQVNAELAYATRLKDDFLANMSHELRTPLNAILGMSEGLQEQVFGVLNERQIKAVATIERSGKHLLELINDILDLAKIEAGKLELQKSFTSVKLLCNTSLSFIKQAVFKKNISTEAQIPADVRDIEVDERRMRQVLINLLSNAVKFTPEGGQITLVVKLDRLQQTIQFSVADTGIGIAPEDMPKLFQSFVQIDSRLNRQYSGTGLGLALVKRIVELHEGTVDVVSTKGQGSCFTVTLPYRLDFNAMLTAIPELEATPGREQCQRSPLVTSDSNANAKQPLILLAEDNQANIETLFDYLTIRGYRLITAMNGQEAIALTQQHCPDIILMDIQMPEVDGLEATRQIRATPELAHIPIIALTALVMPGDEEKCLQAGVNAYLAKPISLRLLATTIHQFLM
jgi:PAS domain S-box-containing protein